MKDFFKKATILFGIIFVTSSITFAGISLEEVSVFVKNTNIKIQNQSPIPIKTLLYKGSVYIPSEIISEKMNCSAFLDAKNNTIYLKNHLIFQDFEDTDPFKGEIFVYGEIRKIDKEKKTLTIEQHFDDNSITIEPDIKVSENVVIIMQRNDKKINLDFKDLRVGDIVGLVLNKDHITRGIIMNN